MYEILKKGKKKDRANIKDAAYRLETAAHSKLLEFEDSSIDNNERSTKPKATYPLPLDWDVLSYKKRIREATGSEGKLFESEKVSIVEY